MHVFGAPWRHAAIALLLCHAGDFVWWSDAGHVHGCSTLLGLSASGWSAPSSPKYIRSPVAAPAGGCSGSTTSCASFDAHMSMPCDLMPRMLRGFRLQSTMTDRSCAPRTLHSLRRLDGF